MIGGVGVDAEECQRRKCVSNGRTVKASRGSDNLKIQETKEDLFPKLINENE